MIDFTNITYLQSGNERQKKAYAELTNLGLFEKLKKFDPILAGTIPIGIDIPESDLDILCQCQDHLAFKSLVIDLFGTKEAFNTYSKERDGMMTTVAKFKGDYFNIEIFAMDLPTSRQQAYRHMLIEYELLEQNGPEFKSEIIKLKIEGYKTEPAFAKLLGLEGDPYVALLKFEGNISI